MATDPGLPLGKEDRFFPFFNLSPELLTVAVESFAQLLLSTKSKEIRL